MLAEVHSCPEIISNLFSTMKFLGSLAMIAGLLVGQVLNAVPRWDIDFAREPFQVGQPPATKPAKAGVVNTQPTGLVRPEQFVVQEQFSAGDAVMVGRPVVMTCNGDGKGVAMVLTGAAADYTSPSAFEFSFDFMLRADPQSNGEPGAGNFLEIRLQNKSDREDSRFIGRIIFHSGGGIRFFNSFGADQTFKRAFSLNKTHRFRGVMNAEGTEFTIHVDDKPVGTVAWSYGNEGPGEVAGLRTIAFRNGTTNAAAVWSAGINHIRVTAGPSSGN